MHTLYYLYLYFKNMVFECCRYLRNFIEKIMMVYIYVSIKNVTRQI